MIAPFDVLSPLAQSLALCDWTADALAAHLRARLPPAQRQRAKGLAARLTGAFPGHVAPDPARILRWLSGDRHGAALVAHARKAALTPPAQPLDGPGFRPTPALPALDLPVLTTSPDLADFLGLTPDQLTRFADLRALSAHSTDPFGPHYMTRTMAKPAGGLRLIEEPRPFLKKLHRRILSGLLNKVPPHPAAFGFVRGRSCTTAAARHCGEQVVLGFDLKDFFAHVDVARVYAIFRSLGYPPAVARNLAGLCTAITPPAVLHDHPDWRTGPQRNRHLPQGAPTSPALANLAALALDRRLAGLARRLGAAYTRYADDLTFSGDRRIAAPLLRAVPEIVAEEGFALNPTKTRSQPGQGRQVVTGLVVNHRLNLPRGEYDRLKATLHHLSRPDDPRRADPGFRAHLLGRIGWLAQVNPGRAARLYQAFDAL